MSQCINAEQIELLLEYQLFSPRNLSMNILKIFKYFCLALTSVDPTHWADMLFYTSLSTYRLRLHKLK